MGIEDHSRKSRDGAIAAFDFDGTLTVRDSFQAFLAWRVGPLRLFTGLARLAPAGLRYGFDRDRRRLKAAAVKAFLAGLTEAELSEQAARFCGEVFDGLMRPDALATWRAWRDRGVPCVIVTASPELIVAPFAARLGADRLIGTRLETDSDGRLTGPILGENCRGPEKVARLKAAFGPEVRLLAAYGDSAGDREMIAMAEEKGLKVFTARP